MNIDLHEEFQRVVDESLAGVVSAEKEQSLREHLSTCTPCQEYLSASNRVILGLRGFSFEVSPALNAKVVAALRLQLQQFSSAHPLRPQVTRRPIAEYKVWAAFGLALLLSFVGSALLYQMAARVAVSMHFDIVQIQRAVLVFWLLPSLCAALRLLAAVGEKRGMA